jgi:hypothetical protein
LVDFKKLDNLSDCGKLPLAEEVTSVVIHLSPVAPEEIFLRPFYQPGAIITEFSFRLLLLSFFHELVSVQYIVFLAVGKLLSQWVC